MNLVGFLDVVLLLFLLLVLQVRDPRWQLLAAAVAAVIAVLFHELYAIAFLPLSLIGPVSWAAQSGRMRWRRWLLVGLAASVPWMVVLRIARESNMTPAQFSEMQKQIQARVDFAPYDAMLSAVLATSDQQNRELMHGYMKAGTWWVEEGFGLLAFLPTTCFFLAVAWRVAGRERRWIRWYLVLSTLAPMLLNIVAYDRYRWLTMMAINAVLCAIATCWAYPRSQASATLPAFGIEWRRAAFFLLALNLATDVGFFEGRARNFPFADYWSDYRAVKQHRLPLLWPPELIRQQH